MRCNCKAEIKVTDRKRVPGRKAGTTDNQVTIAASKGGETKRATCDPGWITCPFCDLHYMINGPFEIKRPARKQT